MTDNDTQVRLTRRRALQGAAWSAPVVVVASAVPAFAASPSTDLVLVRGSSAAIQSTDGFDNYFDLQFTGLSVVVPGTGVAAGQLTLTVTFTPTTPGGPSTLLVLDTPSGWAVTPASGTAAAVVLTSAAGVAGGSEVQLNGIFVGANESTAAQTGTFVVTAAAPGFTSDVESFATGPARATRGAQLVRRPVV